MPRGNVKRIVKKRHRNPMKSVAFVNSLVIFFYSPHIDDLKPIPWYFIFFYLPGKFIQLRRFPDTYIGKHHSVITAEKFRKCVGR